MDDGQDDHCRPVVVANQKVLLDSVKGEAGGEVRFQAQNLGIRPEPVERCGEFI